MRVVGQQPGSANPEGSDNVAPPPVSEEVTARLQAQQEEMVKGAISETLPLIISAAMAYNKRDVARTLKGVCKKVRVSLRRTTAIRFASSLKHRSRSSSTTPTWASPSACRGPAP